MNIPKEFKAGKHKWILVKMYENGLNLYENQYGYKECFSLFDLGCISEKIRPRKDYPIKLKGEYGDERS